MKKRIRTTVIALALCLILGSGIAAYADSYSGDAVNPGLPGILGEDELTLPDNTDWATLTARWGVKVVFLDADGNETSEVVPVSEDRPGTTENKITDPEKEGYRFFGWERDLENGGDGPAKLNDDGTVTVTDGPGPIIFKANMKKILSVKYEAAGDPTWGTPDFDLPEDDEEYFNGDEVELAAALSSTQTTAKDSKGNEVKGTWSFSVWDHEDGFVITEDTTIKGTWTFTPEEPEEPEEPPVDPGKDPEEEPEKPPVDPGKDPEEPKEPEPKEDPEEPKKPDNPKTGDESDLMLWAMLLAVSAAAVCGAVICRKRKNN